jgi:hypothetical protein
MPLSFRKTPYWNIPNLNRYQLNMAIWLVTGMKFAPPEPQLQEFCPSIKHWFSIQR